MSARTIVAAGSPLVRNAGGLLRFGWSQTHALGFYARLGYAAHGEEFLDAGIPHLHMVRELG